MDEGGQQAGVVVRGRERRKKQKGGRKMGGRYMKKWVGNREKEKPRRDRSLSFSDFDDGDGLEKEENWWRKRRVRRNVRSERGSGGDRVGFVMEKIGAGVNGAQLRGGGSMGGDLVGGVFFRVRGKRGRARALRGARAQGDEGGRGRTGRQIGACLSQGGGLRRARTVRRGLGGGRRLRDVLFGDGRAKLGASFDGSRGDGSRGATISTWLFR